MTSILSGPMAPGPFWWPSEFLPGAEFRRPGTPSLASGRCSHQISDAHRTVGSDFQFDAAIPMDIGSVSALTHNESDPPDCLATIQFRSEGRAQCPSVSRAATFYKH